MDVSKFQVESAIVGDCDEDTTLLRQMALGARSYLSSFRWCPAGIKLYLAYGVGGLVAVFLVELEEASPGMDRFLWVIQGDMPSEYLVTDEAPGPAKALIVYCDLMDDWIAAVREETDLGEVFPVVAEPTLVNAESLESRVGYLREKIIPKAARH